MEDKKIPFGSASPISPYLYMNLYNSYINEINKAKIKNKGFRRYKLHIFSTEGLNGFLTANAILEAIIHEQFSSDLIRNEYKENLLFEIIEKAEKWDIKMKIEKFPKFLFSKTFNKSQDLYSDIIQIISIRNCITHYQYSLYEGPEKGVKHLRNKNLTYPKPEKNGSSPWFMELFSTECIRFCINTISLFVEELSKLESPKYKELNGINKDIFQPLKEDVVKKYFLENNINPDGIDDPSFDVKL